MPERELKVVFYRGNSYPRSLSVSTKFISRLVLLVSGASIVAIALTGVILRNYVLNRGKDAHSPQVQKTELADLIGPFNSAEEQVKSLKDEVDVLKSRVKNLTTTQESAQEIDTRHPVLALFTPNIVDRTKDQDQITAKNFSFTPGNHRESATLSFELHNNHPDSSVQKGYIVVLGKSRNALKTYPNVFNTKGPYLIDFEKGESFQVARFRLVNAQFDFTDSKEPVTSYQVLIFKRTGELLLNLLTEVSSK